MTRKAGDAGSRGPVAGPVQDDHSGKEPNLEESLRGGTERDEGRTRGDASGVRSCKVRLVGGRLRLYFVAPEGAEIESVGGNCREACWGQYKEDSSNHHCCVWLGCFK